LRLLQSIRWFGGAVAGANVLVCVVGGVAPGWEEELERWGAFVKVVARFDQAHSQLNKFSLLEAPEIVTYDTIMLLDCDMILAQDPSPFLKTGLFCARVADSVALGRILIELFARYRIELLGPEQRRTSADQSTVWFCEPGVLIFPRSLIKTFCPVWRMYAVDLLQHEELLGAAVNCLEQLSLALAFHASPIEFCSLPLAMNLPLDQCGPGAAPEMRRQDPIIINCTDVTEPSGRVRRPPHGFAGVRIDAFNRRVRKYRIQVLNRRLFGGRLHFLRKVGARGSCRFARYWDIIGRLFRARTCLL